MADLNFFLRWAAVAAALAGCAGDDDRPYLEFAGGGFIYNYRLPTATYGFVARGVRKIPDGGIIEVEFENPNGGPAIVIRQPASAARLTYKFETPPVDGIKAVGTFIVRKSLIRIRLAANVDQ